MLHSIFPYRVLCGEIGNPKEIEPATQEILINHGITEGEFTPEASLPYHSASARTAHNSNVL